MLIGRERLEIGSVSALAVLVVESLDKPPKLIVEQCRKHVDGNEGPIVGRFVYTAFSEDGADAQGNDTEITIGVW